MNRDKLAETIHRARWPADRAMAITPFEDEDKNGREYCYRIADAVIAAQMAENDQFSRDLQRIDRLPK